MVKATVPKEGPGTVDVTIQTAGGVSTPNPPADKYTYEPPPVVTSISPYTGPSEGGNTVTISGLYFNGTPVDVDFGGMPATDVKVGPTCKFSVP